MDNELVEAVARALSIPQHHTAWDSLPESERDLFYMQAEAALAATPLASLKAALEALLVEVEKTERRNCKAVRRARAILTKQGG